MKTSVSTNFIFLLFSLIIFTSCSDDKEKEEPGEPLPRGIYNLSYPLKIGYYENGEIAGSDFVFYDYWSGAEAPDDWKNKVPFNDGYTYRMGRAKDSNYFAERTDGKGFDNTVILLRGNKGTIYDLEGSLTDIGEFKMPKVGKEIDNEYFRLRRESNKKVFITMKKITDSFTYKSVQVDLVISDLYPTKCVDVNNNEELEITRFIKTNAPSVCYLHFIHGVVSI